MKTKNWLLSGMLAVTLACGGMVVAQEMDINHAKHPNLAEAQQHIQQAYAKIEDAQASNKDQLGGHAAKAKDLLVQASRELKAAAEYADHHR